MLRELRIDLGPAAEALERAGRRLVALLRTVEDPERPTIGLDWTLGQLGAHLAARTELLVGYLAGTATPEGAIADIAAHNAAQVRERAGEPFATHVEQIAANVHALAERTKGHLGTDPYPWYSGLTLDVATGTAIALAEVVVHGFDVARSVGAPWPIPADDARTALKASLALAPHYLDREAARGADVTYRLAIAGLDRVRIRIADDALEVLPDGPSADCTIRARPAPFLLLGFGRLTPWRAALTGKVLATGHRPWRALTMTRYLLPP
jgi:uncharacterized protein (TIGR03083 family)